MRKAFTNLVKRTGLLVLCMVLVSSIANGTTFTAVASGNFNSAATWGGVAPGSTITTDIIIIPTGFTVTLTSDETFNFTSTLTVNGTLTSTTSALILNSGSLTGNGTITVDSVVMGLTSGLTYTGSITAQQLTSTGANINVGLSMTVNSTLRLVSGTLNITAGTLTMSGGSNIEVSGGVISVTGIGTFSANNPYSVSYTSTSTNTGVEISGAWLTNVTVNVPGTVTLSSNLNIQGTMTLMSGTLVLNNNNLSFNGSSDFATTGTGNISSTSGSNISFSSSNNFTGGLRFASGGNTVNTLTVHMSDSSKTAMIASDLNVSGQLKLQVGKLNVGSSNLTIMTGALVNGGASTSYVVTNSTGRLSMHLVANTLDTFAVGSMAHFAPAIVAANSSSASGDVSLSVIDGVYTNGVSGAMASATQPVVATTWYIASSASSGINYTIQLMWSTNMEVNGFHRTNAYISHYTGSAWDATVSGSATLTASGMYSLSRSGITSLSPFTVADKNARLGVTNVYANNDMSIYPNPVSDVLYIKSTTKVDKVSIYDMTGHLIKVVNLNTNTNAIPVNELSAGLYYAYITGQDQTGKTVQKFVKE